MHIVRKIKVRGSDEPVEVPLDKAFWVHDGPVAMNLKELRSAIEDMSDEQFEYHTARNGNDFARWIRDVLGDIDCADALSDVASRKEVLRVLSKFV